MRRFLGSMAICSGLMADAGRAASEPTAVPPVAQASPISGAAQEGRGRLGGEISFSRQEPVVGATVVLVHDGDPGRLFLGNSDLRGSFRFENLPEGTWTIGVLREGAAPVLKSGVRIKAPARSVVDIVLKKQTGQFDPPVIDLARFEARPDGSPPAADQPPPEGVPHTADQPQPEEAPPAADPPGAGGLRVRVLDRDMKPVREARVLVRSRGPRIDPLRGTTDAHGDLGLRAPEPGEYSLRVEMPGFLPARLERLRLGRTAPFVTVILTPRPLDYPAQPSDLLPEPRPVPPEGFPGSAEKKPETPA